ncbi:MAG: GLPGLI family protein [Eudoraea sp.]|nr:GLPGLI family protein [Eudoraea sp.]
MKYTSILLFFCIIAIRAQQTFISDVKVDYDIISIYNNQSQEIKGRLLFNSAYSEFRFKPVSKNENVSKIQENLLNDYKLNVNVVYRDTLSNSYYFDKRQNTVIKTALDFNSNQKVFIKETINSLQWKISSETKNIQSFECIKATLKYQGNKYTAWFTTSIPTSFGPYDFGQVLGLIMELYSEDRRLYIVATQITYPFKETVALPDEHIGYITQAEYDALNQKYLDSIANAIKEKTIRILTKSQRGVNISNVKIEKKENKKKRDD